VGDAERIASVASGTNSSSTALTIGVNVLTIRDTVDCDASRRSPETLAFRCTLNPMNIIQKLVQNE
jgi:hypothetical protein